MQLHRLLASWAWSLMLRKTPYRDKPSRQGRVGSRAKPLRRRGAHGGLQIRCRWSRWSRGCRTVQMGGVVSWCCNAPRAGCCPRWGSLQPIYLLTAEHKHRAQAQYTAQRSTAQHSRARLPRLCLSVCLSVFQIPLPTAADAAPPTPGLCNTTGFHMVPYRRVQAYSHGSVMDV
ncbi:hypothetical protein F4803DRAFT_517058 [Xylaria telfairii]|nr:hypothetical protein F4803DRAFT_517058 [Xylaria telfairii]